MNDAGLGEFCQHTNTLDVDRLIEQFTEIERRSGEIRQAIATRNEQNAQLLGQQFAALSALLIPAARPEATEPGRDDAPVAAVEI